MDYDEEAVLTKYIWDNYRRHFTTLERMGEKAVIAQEKAPDANPRMAETLRQRLGGANDPQVVAAMNEGPDAFRLRMQERVLRDYKDEIVINRCPNCNRIVRTPYARQCLWCGYDWH